MVKAAKHEHEENGDIDGEYQRPDAQRAIEIYDKQIAPKLTHISTLKGDLSEPWDQLKEQSRIPRTVFNFVQKLAEATLQRPHEQWQAPRLENFKINKVTPFWSARDSADECLEEVHALLTVLEHAFRLSGAIGSEPFMSRGQQYENDFDMLRDDMKATALAGVAKLVAFAQFQLDTAVFANAQRRDA